MLFHDEVVIYGYNKQQGYIQINGEEELEAGRGYWILCDKPLSYTLTGLPIYENTLSFTEEGWDMIGGCSSSAWAFSDNCNISVIYEYNQGSGYKRLSKTDKLEYGKGYWILCTDINYPCNLQVEGDAW